MFALTPGNSNNIFAKLKIIAKIEEQSVTANNTNILVKAKTNGDAVTISDGSFNCQLFDKSEIKCKVFKFNGNSLSNLKDISFATTSVLGNLNESKTGNYYVIDFSSETDNEKKKKLTDENISKTIVFVGTDKSKKSEFDFKSKIVGKFDATSGNSHNVLLLKDIPNSQ